MKEYLIDFDSIIIEAQNEEEAYEKAQNYILRKEIRVCNVEENK